MSLTFDKWYDRQGCGQTHSDPREACRKVWEAAQAQCALGPWKPIEELPDEERSYLVLWEGRAVRLQWDPQTQEWYDDETMTIPIHPTHFIALPEQPPELPEGEYCELRSAAHDD